MKITLSHLKKMQRNDQKIACITAYDASFAYWANLAKVEVILVGDSLGMVVQGNETTLPVSLDEMVYHTKVVNKGLANSLLDSRSEGWKSWVIADFPFMTDASVEQSIHSAALLMKEGKANMVKLEGGDRVLPIIEKLSSLGVPTCGHLGLLPQSVERNGYKMAGKTQHSAEKIVQDAINLERAGADMLVLECVPGDLAERVTASIDIPVIGIGSGNKTDGQVLVMYDLLGITPGKMPSFAKNFLTESNSIFEALQKYVSDVKSRVFPS